MLLALQLLRLQVSHHLLVTENQQLKASLGRAVATTSELKESLGDKEAASHALIVEQSQHMKHGGEAENNYEGKSCCLLPKSIPGISGI